jgi:hypothetical protein
VSELRFGDYLGQLLREQGGDGSRLASMLGIDPALVYRWLRNEAVPKLDTVYCDEIAQHLHLNQTALQQLKETQVYSLSKPMERRPKARSNSAAIESGYSHSKIVLANCPRGIGKGYEILSKNRSVDKTRRDPCLCIHSRSQLFQKRPLASHEQSCLKAM